ncbi:MAG: hypothetical protein OXF42_00365 [Candidatus Dadabacteria bacterium]|nr:hypothetical protein [Candidatus Dadabacteria bacterium]
MLKSFMRRALLAVVGLAVSAPLASAVEIDLDEYPSFFRTRARYFNKTTYKYGNPADNRDRIFFVDSTLRVSPRLQLGENVKIVVQADIADNVIWGGITDQLLGGGSTLVNSSISPTDSYRGALLTPTWDKYAYLDRRVRDDAVRPGYPRLGESCPDSLPSSFGVACRPTSSGSAVADDGEARFNENAAVDPDAGWFNLRTAYAHIDLPKYRGFLRVGRQTFDWGLGIVQNGGNDPSSDFGTLIDRVLVGKTAELNSGSTITGLLFADIYAGGTGSSLAPPRRPAAHQGLGGAIVYDAPEAFWGANTTLGMYVYPWMRHENFVTDKYFNAGTGDLDRLTVYSFMADFRRGDFRLVGEFHGAFGKITDVNGFKDCAETICQELVIFNRDDNVEIKHHMAWAARLEFMPEKALRKIGAEYGWVDGDRSGEYWNGQNDNEIEGGLLAFSPAYNIDNLLFKHILPTIYQSASNGFFSHTEAGIQNSRYLRAYVDFRLSDWLTMKNQWIAAWNNETEGVFVEGENLASFIANEVETTFRFKLAEGVFLDFIGSIVLPGTGLEQMYEAQAWNEIVRRSNDDIFFTDASGEWLGGIPLQPGAHEDNDRDLIAYFVDGDGNEIHPGSGNLRVVVPGVRLYGSPDRCLGRNALPRDIATGQPRCVPNFKFPPLGPDGRVDLTTAPEEDTGADVHRRAYNALRQEFSEQYQSDRSRIWSLQTVLTVNLGGGE